jgi:pentatricopeptide repeat protein
MPATLSIEIALMAWFCRAGRHDVAFSMINLAA